jgi:hypothetical protein
MNRQKTNQGVWMIGLPLMMLMLAGCNSSKLLTITNVWEQADELEGQSIRVRGRARFFTEPYQGLTGCVPGGGGDIVGRLVLYDEDAPDPHYYGGEQPLPTIVVSSDSLQCKGNTCQITCEPFNPQEGAVFELVGTLRVEHQESTKVLTLEDVILTESRQLMGEKLEPIPTGTFQYSYP